MEESEAAQEIEALKAIWQEVEDRPPVWNSPAIAIPVCPLGVFVMGEAKKLVMLLDFVVGMMVLCCVSVGRWLVVLMSASAIGSGVHPEPDFLLIFLLPGMYERRVP